MTATRIVNHSAYGMACTVCNEFVIAPRWSEYVGKHKVRRFWSCENCSHHLETVINLRKSCRLVSS
jgi:hypothetical protein